jgi:hypothetical protein
MPVAAAAAGADDAEAQAMAAMFQANTEAWDETQDRMSQYVELRCACSVRR